MRRERRQIAWIYSQVWKGLEFPPDLAHVHDPREARRVLDRLPHRKV
jgi:hypothetical protein